MATLRAVPLLHRLSHNGATDTEAFTKYRLGREFLLWQPGSGFYLSGDIFLQLMIVWYRAFLVNEEISVQ